MGFVKTAAQETQIQEALELCPTGLQNGGGKKCKVTIRYMNCVSTVIIGDGKK